DKYGRLLTSKDPHVRARACEMLMQIEDIAVRSVAWLRPLSGEPCLPIVSFNQDNLLAIVRLLKDESVEVRRAAAMALTRLATKAQAESLKRALEDDDWQVRFAAAAALEAIGEIAALRQQALAAPLPELSFEALGRAGSWQQLSEADQDKLLTELKKPEPDHLAIR